MSSISISGASSGWSNGQGSQVSRQQQHQQRMFDKVDSDGSGAVSASEFDTLVSDVSAKTGASLGDSSELFSQMDGDGDGSLSSDELQSGMKSVMPEPPSTMAFAQSRSGTEGTEGAHGPHGKGGPPPAGGAQGASGTTASEDSTDYDPLDTNEDGVVSQMERLAGELKELAAKGGEDGVSSEIAQLAQKLYEQIRQTADGSSGSGCHSGQVSETA